MKAERLALGEIGNLTQLTFRSAVDGMEDFAIIRPPPENAKGGHWVVVLHGHGSTGMQLFTREDLRTDWLPKLIAGGHGILCPNLRGNAWMGKEAVEDLHALLAEIRKQYGAQSFILAGGSMGGTSCLIYSVIHPEDVAGVVALCPCTDLPGFLRFLQTRQDGILKEIRTSIETSYRGDVSLIDAHSCTAHAKRLTMPVFLAHGISDPIIPVAQSRRLAALMEDRKTDFMYVEIEGGHDAPLPRFGEGLSWLSGRRSYVAP
jgi:pimeloyl-ACP methyl ester carboxylesterase